MDKFVARLNIDHYRKVLAAECEPERRLMILRLLAEEEATLAALEHPYSPGAAEDPPATANSPAAAASPPTTEDDGVSHLNLEYYRQRLVTETSPVMRGILTRLIAEEEARLAPPDARKISGDD
jgi:hypothetical protein